MQQEVYQPIIISWPLSTVIQLSFPDKLLPQAFNNVRRIQVPATENIHVRETMIGHKFQKIQSLIAQKI